MMLMLDVMEVEEEEHDDLLADQDKYSWGRQVSVAHLGVVQVMPKGGWSELATTQSQSMHDCFQTSTGCSCSSLKAVGVRRRHPRCCRHHSD
jgi:hypothetical protein